MGRHVFFFKGNGSHYMEIGDFLWPFTGSEFNIQEGHIYYFPERVVGYLVYRNISERLMGG